jgi:GNAT superfamily N-acetyltransferase
MTIRPAHPYEATAITELLLASKAYWGYPREWLEIWTPELTVTFGYIESNMIYVADENELLGVVSVIEQNGAHCLNYLFIHPSHIRKGIGERLFKTAADWCKANGIAELHIEADPHARGFYEKMGATYIKQVPYGAIPGRTLPLLIYKP